MLNPASKAQRETEEAIATARIDTKKRALWSYVRADKEDKPAEYALTFFQKPANTPVRVARNVKGECMVAVWDGGDEPMIDPHDWPPFGMTEGELPKKKPAVPFWRSSGFWLTVVAAGSAVWAIYEIWLR